MGTAPTSDGPSSATKTVFAVEDYRHPFCSASEAARETPADWSRLVCVRAMPWRRDTWKHAPRGCHPRLSDLGDTSVELVGPVCRC